MTPHSIRLARSAAVSDSLPDGDAPSTHYEEYQRLVRLLPVAVCTCAAPSGILTYYNERAAALWGRSPVPGDCNERFCGAFRLWRPDGRRLPHDESPMARAIRDGRSVRNEDIVIERPDGSRAGVVVNIDPILDRDGAVVGAINAFHGAGAPPDRLALIERLRDRDRRKDEFLATLAHELRNPLAPIRTGVQLIQRAGSDPAVLERTCTMMERQLQHMVRLVDDLLDVARINRNSLELRTEPIELATVIRTALEASQPLIEAASHELSVSLPRESMLVEADAVRLAQAFANLLNNAAKYTERGGRIWLTVERAAASATADEAIVRVRDTGIGIPPEKLPHVFDMFVQVDDSRERTHSGLGIGLTLTQRLIQMHGGDLTASSDGIGRGSEFVVRLPLVPATTFSTREAHHDAVPPDAPVHLRILVADDSHDSAEMLATMLTLLGHEVTTAQDGLDAIERGRAIQPDLVVLDLGMPRLDGYDAARRIREEPWGRRVTLVALTGWGQDDDRFRTRQAGFDEHLVKPVDMDAIAGLLARVAHARTARQLRT